MCQATTVNKKGEKSVVIRRGGCEKQRFTVICIRVDDNKLLPYMIFKHKTIRSITLPGIRVNDKGWMDNSLIVDWITRVWGKQNGA